MKGHAAEPISAASSDWVDATNGNELINPPARRLAVGTWGQTLELL